MPTNSTLPICASLAAILCTVPAAGESASEADVFAWTFVDPGFESSRLTVPVRLAADEGEVARLLASRPEGRRAVLANDLLSSLVGDASDRLVVSGRITDHTSPWTDAAERAFADRFSALAKALAAEGIAVDRVILDGGNPISAESIDTADDLVWLAIRNDERFTEMAKVTLDGTMTPSNPQWAAWNRYADERLGLTLDRAVADPLRPAAPQVVVCRPPVPETVSEAKGGSNYAFRFVAAEGAGGSTNDAMADLVESAVELVAAGSSLEARILPFSHPGTREERHGFAGAGAWNELVRHAVLLGGGRVVHEEDRSGAVVTEDARRLTTVLDDVAEASSPSGFGAPKAPTLVSAADAARPAAAFAKGLGFFATGIAMDDGDRLWRVTFEPGFGAVGAEIDGTRVRIERDPGVAGAWHRATGDAELEFASSAIREALARTGGGLVPADSTDAGPTLEQAGKGESPRLAESGNPAGEFGGEDFNGDGVVDGADLAIYLSGGVPEEAGWNGAGWDDLNGDGIVDGADLAIEMAGDGQWNGAGWNDLNGDGVSDGADLAIRLAGEADEVPGDLNGDGVVDGADLTIKLAGAGGEGFTGGEGSDASDVVDPRLGDAPGRTPRVRIRPRVTDEPPTSARDDATQDGTAPPPDSNTGDTQDTDDTSDEGGVAGQGVDPTVPVTPPATESRPPLPIPAAMSDSLMESAGTSLFVVPGVTADMATMGVEPVRVVYGNGDPAAPGGGISVDHIVSFVEEHWGPNPTGWFTLDYEIPHFERLRRGYEDLEDPEYLHTRDAFVNALREVKSRYPGTRWSVYGVPGQPLRFNIDGNSWTHMDVPAEVKAVRDAKHIAAMSPIIEECDWLSPTIYDRHDIRNAPNPAHAAYVIENYRRRTVGSIQMCRALIAASDRPDRPVMPYMNVLYAPGGSGQELTAIPMDQLLAKQIGPAVEAGAESVVVWTAAGYYARLATVPDRDEPMQQVVREAFVDDALDGQTPAVWQSTAIRDHMLEHFANLIRQASEAFIETRAAAAD